MKTLRPLLAFFAFVAASAVALAGSAATASAQQEKCDSCVVVVDTCCSGLPHIQDPGLPPPSPHVAVETREPNPPTWDFCVTLYDLTQNIPPENTNWNPISRYHGPGGSWNRAKLGTVFGVTLDRYGNIYVTHTSCYQNDATGTGGPGAIYRIDGGSGVVSVFATLPNFPDPNVGGDLPGLGNISYDCEHDQFFVTNMEDGRIYRLKSSNLNNASPATVIDFFDPGTPDNNQAGFAPLTERLWAVQWHGNRVYYGVWATDFNSPPNVNTVRSVALDNTGAFVWWSDRQEIALPPYPNFGGRSAPISDISFSPTGKILLAERGMFGPTQPYPHYARLFEFECHLDPAGFGSWTPANSYSVGAYGSQTNAAGGVDYDWAGYDGPMPPATAAPGLGGSQGRVWATGDAIHLGTPYPDAIYGLQAFRPTGGNVLTSLLIDSDNDVINTDKTLIGDVEIPCPPEKSGTIEGFKFFDEDRDGVKDSFESGLGGWTITIVGPVTASTTTAANGSYSFSGLPSGKYVVSEIAQPDWIQTAPAGGSYSISVLGGTTSGVNFGNYHCQQQPCIKPPGGMTAWWPLDETAGPLAHDIIGAATASWVGSPSVNLGQKVANSIHFTGAGDYVQSSSVGGLNFGIKNFSIDAWVRSTSTDASVRTIVDHRAGTASNPVGYALFMSNSRLGFQLGDGGPTLNFIAPGTSQTLTDGSWHHVAVTLQRGLSNGGTLYVDNTVVLTFNPTLRPGSVSNNGSVRIGQRILLSPIAFDGDIDEVEIFNRWLPGSTIAALYNAGSNGKCKKSCYLPRVRVYGQNTNSIQVCFNICNNDWSQPSMSFTWSLAGLPVGPGCTVAGPTSFSPSSGTVSVPAGQCMPICVSIQRPAGLVPGQSACYQLSVLNNANGTCCTSKGVLLASDIWHITNSPTDLIQVPDGGSVPISFDVVNTGPSSTFNYQVDIVPSDDDPNNNVGRLNGLPPGEPVIGTLTIAPGTTGTVNVSLSYEHHDRLTIHEIILEADMDGDGVLERTFAEGSESDSVHLVMVPDDDQEGRLDRVIGFPNPFEIDTGVRFTLGRTGAVAVRVFDVNGRLVRSLHDGGLSAGAHTIKWDGRDARGGRARSGMYFIRVQTSDRTLETKVVRVK